MLFLYTKPLGGIITKLQGLLAKICQNSKFFGHNFAKNENFKNPKRRAPTHAQNTPVDVNISKIGPAVTEKRLRTDARTDARTDGRTDGRTSAVL